MNNFHTKISNSEFSQTILYNLLNGVHTYVHMHACVYAYMDVCMHIIKMSSSESRSRKV